MCLGVQLKPSGQRAAIKRLTDEHGYVRVWKVVKISRRKQIVRYRSPMRGTVLPVGVKKAKMSRFSSNDGWHAFRDKESAVAYSHSCWVGGKSIVIECLALPEWVLRCGRIEAWLSRKIPALQTIVLEKLCFPEYPKKRVGVREFARLLASTKRGKK